MTCEIDVNCNDNIPGDLGHREKPQTETAPVPTVVESTNEVVSLIPPIHETELAYTGIDTLVWIGFGIALLVSGLLTMLIEYGRRISD